MQSFRTVDEAYNYCLTQGSIVPKNLDSGIIGSSLRIAKEDFETAKDSVKKKRWNSAYKLYYDVLHQLVESFLRFDNIKVKNHLCLFTTICVKHPELELNWNFFEKVRTKRNGIQYYGLNVIEKDFKEVALEFDLTINLLFKIIKEKLE
tara:strand:+ start:66 stop:512 length:447 start_codon:yes stop_codon:yes gene_type:complete